MDSETQAAQRFDFDIAPVLKLYLDSIEAWKKNYDKFAQSMPMQQMPAANDAFASTFDQAMANWQKTGEEVFKRFVEQQIELCRFFGKRWEQYLKLPEQFSNCKTPADAAQLQMAFLNQMATEYAKEGSRLTQPITELMSRWLSSRPTH